MYEDLLSAAAFIVPIILFIVFIMIKDRWFHNPINEIKTFIEMMRGHPDEIGKLNTYVFTQGECWRFAAIALVTFPHAKAHLVWDKLNRYTHVVVEYWAYYFDITGVYYYEKSALLNYPRSRDQFEIIEKNISVAELATRFANVPLQRVVDYHDINYEVLNIHSPVCNYDDLALSAAGDMQTVHEFMQHWNNENLLRRIVLHTKYTKNNTPSTVSDILESHLRIYTLDWIYALLFSKLRNAVICLGVDKDTCKYEVFVKYGDIYFSRYSVFDTGNLFNHDKIHNHYDIYLVDPKHLVINNNFNDYPFTLDINIDRAYAEKDKYENPDISNIPMHWIADGKKEGINITSPVLLKIINNYSTYFHAKPLIRRFLKIDQYFRTSHTNRLTIKDAVELLGSSERTVIRILDKLTNIGILIGYRVMEDDGSVSIFYVVNYDQEWNHEST